jgi:hypothetical protein
MYVPSRSESVSLEPGRERLSFNILELGTRSFSSEEVGSKQSAVSLVDNGRVECRSK